MFWCHVSLCVCVLFDDSTTWRVWAAIWLSSAPHCLVRGRWFSPKAKGDHPDRNHGNCSQPQGRSRRTYMVSDCCAHPGQSACRSTLCLTAPTFVGRESGVCDTNIPYYNPLVVMVITDGSVLWCKKICLSRIGLFAHRRTHRWRNPSSSTVHSMCVKYRTAVTIGKQAAWP